MEEMDETRLLCKCSGWENLSITERGEERDGRSRRALTKSFKNKNNNLT